MMFIQLKSSYRKVVVALIINKTKTTFGLQSVLVAIF